MLVRFLLSFPVYYTRLSTPNSKWWQTQKENLPFPLIENFAEDGKERGIKQEAEAAHGFGLSHHALSEKEF